MRCLKLDNGFEVAEDNDAIIELIRARLNFFLGEWFILRREGIPYIPYIIDNRDLLTATLIDEISRIDGVIDVRINNIDINNINRKITLNISLDTIYGSSELNTNIG